MKTVNKFLTLLSFITLTFSLQSQTLNPTFSINAAGSADTFKGGYTFAYASSGTPWNGALISFGGFANQYDCQISTNYFGNNISFRTKNGDLANGAGVWNSWNELATKGANSFIGDQNVKGHHYVDGYLTCKLSSNEGGAIGIENPLKTGIGTANLWRIYNMTGQYGNSLQFWNYNTVNATFGGGPKFTILDGGNVGIGTQTPAAKLDIFGNNATSTNLILSANYKDSYRWRLNTLDRGNAIDLDFTGSGGSDEQEQVLKLSRSTSGRPEFQLYNNTIVANDGNVGIGTPAPDAKLTVKGRIHTQEVKIDLLGALVPDYVFADNYKLKTLQEVDEYIKTNSHLPEIPSAKEMGENGLMVGEMNLSLLKKIEELTLYAIEQQKKLDLLSNRLSKLEKK